MTSSWTDAGQLPWLEDERHRAGPRHRPPRRRAGRRVEPPAASRRALTARRAVVLATGTRPRPARARPGRCRAVGQPRRHRGEAACPAAWSCSAAARSASSSPRRSAASAAEQVTVLEVGPRLLAREEPFAGDEVRGRPRGRGHRRRALGPTWPRPPRRPPAARTAPGGGPRSATARASEPRDELLVAAGRRAATERRRPGAPSAWSPALRRGSTTGCGPTGVGGGWLYAVGDCNGLAPLTHMGKYQARIAGDVIPGKDARDRARPRRRAPGDLHRPPGLRRRPHPGRGAGAPARPCGPSTYGTGDVAGAYVSGQRHPRHQQAASSTSPAGSWSGATFTGPGVQELLHSATVAVAGEVPLERLWHAVPSFPTISEVWLRLLETYGL